jgi:hypothetical protein
MNSQQEANLRHFLLLYGRRTALADHCSDLASENRSSVCQNTRPAAKTVPMVAELRDASRHCGVVDSWADGHGIQAGILHRPIGKRPCEIIIYGGGGCCGRAPNARVPDDGLESLIGGEPGIKY